MQSSNFGWVLWRAQNRGREGGGGVPSVTSPVESDFRFVRLTVVSAVVGALDLVDFVAAELLKELQSFFILLQLHRGPDLLSDFGVCRVINEIVLPQTTPPRETEEQWGGQEGEEEECAWETGGGGGRRGGMRGKGEEHTNLNAINGDH